MEPLHVSMTGVRMGERFVQFGCDDARLLAGLAAKVGLSGAAAAVTLDERTAARARKAAAASGVLVEVQVCPPPSPWPFDAGAADMVVVDDTNGGFARMAPADRAASLSQALAALRPSGRIEMIEGLGGGWPHRAVARPAGYDGATELRAAGFQPVRVLAERERFRFVEGLKA